MPKCMAVDLFFTFPKWLQFIICLQLRAPKKKMLWFQNTGSNWKYCGLVYLPRTTIGLANQKEYLKVGQLVGRFVWTRARLEVKMYKLWRSLRNWAIIRVRCERQVWNGEMKTRLLLKWQFNKVWMGLITYPLKLRDQN